MFVSGRKPRVSFDQISLYTYNSSLEGAMKLEFAL